MKDNISIIFAAIIGTFLIVLLPLYSILDRQDSMSYNVVLTETTNFVDEIRNNGFIDKESYYNYISALASTSNTYKVNIEVYKKTLIHETSKTGKIKPDSYVEVVELDNTKDVLQVLEGEKSVNVTDSNKKNNVYLLKQNDEIYIKVYNTNITSGSIIYNLISGVTDRKVIDVSYGGVVNKVNWELYHQIQEEGTKLPEVVLSVPTNKVGNTNIVEIENEEVEGIDCTDNNLSEEERVEYCSGQSSSAYENYTYLYNLEETNNKTIKIAVELRQIDSIVVGVDSVTGEERFKKVSELSTTDISNEENQRTTTENYIIQNYIQLNGMYANKDLILRAAGDYYVLDIILTNVRMRDLDYISSLASVTILPGLGKDENGTLSLGAESIQIELLDSDVVNEVNITGPYNWNKYLKEKNLDICTMPEGKVFKNMDIAFVINCSGINGHSDEELIEAIRQGIVIHDSNAKYSGLEIYAEDQLQEEYGINIKTTNSRHIVIKFKYEEVSNTSNYIQLKDRWTETNIEDIIEEQEDEELLEYAKGARSEKYKVLEDKEPPILPQAMLEGEKGKNGWYTTDVTAILEPSVIDNSTSTGSNDGSGVEKSLMIFSGPNTGTLQYEKNGDSTSYNLTVDGKTKLVLKSYDYVGNVAESDEQTIKIDKTPPTKPRVALSGTSGLEGWYTSNVAINVTPGTDVTSEVDRTTIKINGANTLSESERTSHTLTKDGISEVVVRTYDKAGNYSEEVINVKIDKSIPPEATIKVVSGEKYSGTQWYHTDVTLNVTVDAGDSISSLGTCSYRITGSSEVEKTFENATDITITKNGTHNITVYTYTQAGNFSTKTYTVKIDKNLPNAPEIKPSGTTGENNWFKSDVEVQIISKGDTGTSNEKRLFYTIKTGDVTSSEIPIQSGDKITLTEEGEHILTVYTQDMALNQKEVEQTIKIDKTKPNADFNIKGTKGQGGWYVSEVEVAYKNATDDVSGIATVTTSPQKITNDTSEEGREVTLTVKDKAGWTRTKTTKIKVDITDPTKPEIKFKEVATGSGIAGVYLYNKNVEMQIKPGTDTYLENTTYEVIKTSDNSVIVPTTNTEGTTINLTENGKYKVTVKTYDKAGNVSTTEKVIWINKQKPATPEIISINGTNVEEKTNINVNGTSKIINLELSGLSEGNDVKIVLINQSTYAREEKNLTATADGKLSFELSSKGKYSISITQINMYGTISNPNTGIYYYTYK